MMGNVTVMGRSLFTCHYLYNNVILPGIVCMVLYVDNLHSRVYLSVAAAAIYMASQASEHKKTQKGDLQ